MKRAIAVSGLFFLLGAPVLFAQKIETLLQAPLDSLYGKENARRLVVCFNMFTYSDQGLASAFSRYLESNLALALVQCPQFELFARDKVEKILETQQLALSDLFSEKDAVRIGNLKSIQAMLSGRFFDAGENVEIFIDLTAVETGTVSAVAKLVVPKTLIPGHIGLRPDNYQEAVRLLGELDQVDANGTTEFAIKAWTQRGDGGVYVDGENLAIHFYANADCFLKMYHIGVNGDMALIFPNQFQPDNKIVKHKVYTVPDAASGFTFTLEKPYGVEFLKVIASTEQFQMIEASLDNLGPGSKTLITRGLAVKGSRARIAELTLNYTILEKK